MDGRRYDTLARMIARGAARAGGRVVRRTGPLLVVAALLSLPVAAGAFDGEDIAPVPTVAAGASLPAVGADGGEVAPSEPGVGGADAPGAPTATALAATASAGGADGSAPTPVAGDTGSPDATSAPTAEPGSAADSTSPAAVGGGQVAVPVDQAISTRLYDGLCGQLGADPVFQLIDLGVGGSQATPAAAPVPTGQTTAIPARASASIIDATLLDLLESPYAVDVRLNPTDPDTSIACGDVGGQLDQQLGSPLLAIGLGEQNGSGFAGVASFREEEEGRTLVSVFVAPLVGGSVAAAAAPAPEDAEAAPTSAAAAEPTAEAAAPEATPSADLAEGSSILTTEAINLRAGPSTDAAIVAQLDAGVVLEVTGATSDDGWVPVRDPATGRRGYVTLDFVAAAE